MGFYWYLKSFWWDYWFQIFLVFDFYSDHLLLCINRTFSHGSYVDSYLHWFFSYVWIQSYWWDSPNCVEIPYCLGIYMGCGQIYGVWISQKVQWSFFTVVSLLVFPLIMSTVSEIVEDSGVIIYFYHKLAVIIFTINYQ